MMGRRMLAKTPRKLVGIHLDEQTKDFLDFLASHSGLSNSEFITRIINNMASDRSLWEAMDLVNADDDLAEKARINKLGYKIRSRIRAEKLEMAEQIETVNSNEEV